MTAINPNEAIKAVPFIYVSKQEFESNNDKFKVFQMNNKGNKLNDESEQNSCRFAKIMN